MNKTTAQIHQMIASIGYPYAYYAFREDTETLPDPPRITFFYPEGHDVYADGENYSYIDELHIVVYRPEPDLHDDRRIVRILNRNDLSCRWERWYDDKEGLWCTEFIAEAAINEDSFEEGE